jgi:hypothetical protein
MWRFVIVVFLFDVHVRHLVHSTGAPVVMPETTKSTTACYRTSPEQWSETQQAPKSPLAPFHQFILAVLMSDVHARHLVLTPEHMR